MIKNIVIGVLSVLLLVSVLGGSTLLGATTTEYNVKEFLNTVTFSGTTAFTGTETHSGATAYTSTVTIGSGGTAINKYVCGSKTWNPPSIASSTDGFPGYTTTTVAVTAGALGDVVLASFDSATSTEVWTINGKITASATATGSATATLTMVSYQTAALDITTSTAKACVIK